MSLCIGLMSGTSADGIDAALCEITTAGIRNLGAITLNYPEQFQQDLRLAATAPTLDILQIIQLEKEIADYSIRAINELLDRTQTPASTIDVVGSHGHTLRHKPQPDGFSWQIGDAARIAQQTGIDCVSDFRRADIAAGGEGAPLVPAFHQFIARHANIKGNCAFLNIGGIANLSVITPDTVLGFDTGPGNALVDEWVQQHFNIQFDKGGQLAASGKISKTLLTEWLEHPYFQQRPPKSTGRELFSLSNLSVPDELGLNDITATLTQLSAVSIMNAIKEFANSMPIYVCGGGVHNQHLMETLTEIGKKQGNSIQSTKDLGVDPNYLEAMAFAWLGWCRINQYPGNVPTATGAKREVVLGAHYCGR